MISLIGISAGRAAWRQGDYVEMMDAPTIAPILGAAITALAAGVLPLQSPDLITQLLIAASLGLPVLLAVVVLSVLELEYALLTLRWGLIWTSVASALPALATWLLSLVLGSAVGLGLAGLACVVVLFGLFLVVVSMFAKQPEDRALYVSWGLTILGGFVGAAFVAAADAGLKLLGA